MKMKRELCLCLGVAALVASGCSTEVSYGDAKETETVTVDYGSTDLQSLSGKMVQSLMLGVEPLELVFSKMVKLFSQPMKRPEGHI